MTPRVDPAKKYRSYRDVVRVSIPLVISMTTTVVMTFTDRIFLANYSLDAIAAALPAGVAAFVLFTFFADTAGYSNVIIAQYQDTLPLGRITDTFGLIWGCISPEFVDQSQFCSGIFFFGIVKMFK